MDSHYMYKLQLHRLFIQTIGLQLYWQFKSKQSDNYSYLFILYSNNKWNPMLNILQIYCHQEIRNILNFDKFTYTIIKLYLTKNLTKSLLKI